jgi:DNA-binding transcriptional LysR family regulator
MDIRQLEVFARVFERQSFSKAAQQLGLSQPTVSNHIQHLEDSLGKKLFDRLGRRVVPTQEAKILYKHAVEILKKREEAIAELLSLDTSNLEGTLKVAASNIPGDYLIPRAIKKIKKLLPKTFIEVEIYDSSRVIKLLKESFPQFEIGFVGLKPKEAKLEHREIVGDEIVLIAPPSFKRESIELKELPSLPLVLREEESGTRKTVEEGLRRAKIDVENLNVVAALGSNTAVKEAVKSSSLFGLVSKCSVRDDVRCKSLKIVKVEGLSIKRKFFAVRRRDITPSPVARKIWENLGRLFKGSEAC